MNSLALFDQQKWDQEVPKTTQSNAVRSLEEGKVLFFPALSFPLTSQELKFLTPAILNPKAKNISYNIHNDQLGGTILQASAHKLLKAMMKRYAMLSKNLLETLIPHYQGRLIQAKTSFRPVEILGRKTSYRKDDTLLHVDSFPSNPTKGQRILRVFTNINSEGKPRVWKTGEPFEAVADKMIPRVSAPFFGLAQLLKLLKITKDLRTPYDHYMLKIHDAMKRDNAYQKAVEQETVQFPSGTSWIVYTDLVSHAAMSGQHVLEQTFHISVKDLHNEATAPLRVLERKLQKALV
jgi:hypothetical protein